MKRHPLITGASITGLGTLASRSLGLVRDMATAALLGLAGGGVMDSLVVGLRIPNLFRKLFAEGALSASYLPVLTRMLEKDRRHAWQLASVLLTCLAIFLILIVLIGEVICGLILFFWGDVPGMTLLIGLTATMLPYMIFICLAAQVAATLHTLSHFAAPALAPIMLNICWLFGIWVICPYYSSDQVAQAYVIAVCVVVAGVFQLAVQLPFLFGRGFRFDFNWSAGKDALAEVLRSMGPMVIGLAVTQVNTLMDSLIAWGLAADPEGPERIAWLGDAVAYPMQQGAAAAVYYGERLYQFPLGILGIAVATAIFPLLSRHAVRGYREQLGADLTLGLRMVMMLGIPASAGLIFLAEPISSLLFQHGEFTAEDATRTARMIACYAVGVWAFCALPVIVRGFYALGDRVTPVRVGMLIVGLNLTLNLTLIWPFAESGLAISTAISAVLQVIILAAIFSRKKSRLYWRPLAATIARALVATSLMWIVGRATLDAIPTGEAISIRALRTVVPLSASVVVYLATYYFLGGRELRWFFKRSDSSGGRN